MEAISKKVLSIIKEVATLEGINEKESLDKVIDYIAISGLYGSEASVRVKTSTMEYLDSTINLSELKNSMVDFLGECYTKVYKQKTPLPDNVNCDNILIDNMVNPFPEVVMIQNVGTGKRGIELIKSAPKSIIMYGTSYDITQYRIAILNKNLFNLPMFILYIEPDFKNKSKIDFKTNSRNWHYANRWVPTKTLLLDRI